MNRNKWTQNEFYAEVEKILLQNGQPFQWQEVDKINGKRKAVIMGATEKCSTVVPVIYVDGLYEKYQCENDGPVLAVEEIFSLVKTNEKEVEMISNTYGKIMQEKNVRMMFLNRDLNEHILKNCPYIEKEDLVIVFYYELDSFSVRITNQIMEMKGLDIEKLYSIAYQNMEKDGYFIKGLNQFLAEKFGMNFEYQRPEFMYVITNKKIYRGAVALLNRELMKQISENLKWKKFYILPSSVHEVIILCYDEKNNVSEIQDIVRMVNKTAVEENEILSDNIYIYDTESMDFTIVN